MVSPGEKGPVITTSVGDSYRLSLDADSDPLRFLDGHFTEVDGLRTGKRVRVEEWRIIEGVHGMPVFVGKLSRQPPLLGMDDHTTGSYIRLDEKASKTLEEHVGDVVLVEGYIEGANLVKVVYFKVLTGDP